MASASNTANSTANSTAISAEDVVSKGEYYFTEEYALKQQLNEKIRSCFLNGIEKLENKECSELVAEHGLASLHLHFPIQKVRLLEAYLMKHLRDELYYWTYAVSKENLGLEQEFFIDNLIVFRIHYPYALAHKAKGVLNPPVQLAEKINIGLGDLRNKHMIAHRVSDFKRQKVGRWLGLLDETNSYSPEEYHGDIPKPARSHGPHIDTWYGHSYDGINLWLAIDGVNEDNTVILYPEMFGHPVDYDPASMYIKAGNQLTKPVKHAMKPGELLVFNPEMLHGTQVNISEQTRVALTTRLNPDVPRFNQGASFHFQHWRSSNDVAKKKYSKISIFPASQYGGKKSIPEKTHTIVQKSIKVNCSKKLVANEPVAVCASSVLPAGDKMALNCRNARLVIVRSPKGLFALSRNCPHKGIDLIDGYHDDDTIYCPGHGIVFNLANGESSCSAFKLRQFKAEDIDGMIVVTRIR